VIDIGVIMQQVRKIMDRAALAIEFIFLFTLLAGLLVMVAAIQAGQDERRQETSLMRVLGATRRQVLTGLLVEFAIVGVVTGVFASAAASIAAYFLATQVFDLIYTPNPWLWVWGIGGSAVVICSAGLLGTYRLLNQSPLIVLRRG
jgi:putative ABC transport system permease protein